MDRSCLECGEALRGRVDKKFCSDLCRNSYNNKINSLNSIYVRNVNTILRKNRKILEELIPAQTAKASRTKLQQRGFNFRYHTHVHTTQKGANYYFCYEYGYLPLENDHVFLVKRTEEN
ncbi:MAG: hypothetical protein JWO44_1146 [Bacteroidetes bacterium]|nr:hypothetical protein [Bacteroidota bacterium]